ncbi:trimeric intracellular cation channel family protein [Mycobacterium sp. KBS0706]|uniref:trimeric intracellular cation channel family protein n=1 Tax=Mycobacterium sp. KBS0706 TaxID=2578109 RepID=UPI00110F798C|nr:trimeric intracellular cation channel family protein [Mycobacterium sp. KBS0706]TSD90335.1 trimeric intracellular cation channel family protein [Mycobacterium sp. KBS0706]
MLLHSLYLIAIVAEAMTAALAAGRRSMDWVGVCLLGCVTALGGGSARDILLDHHPLSWVEHPSYLLLTGGAALLTIAAARLMHHLRKLFLFLDAIGLVVFTVIGANVAMALDLPILIVIASGMITGCVGGVLRDMLCADIPLLFRSELYATVSVVTGGVYVAGLSAGIGHDLVTAAAMIIGLALRLLALRFNWSMPKFVYTHDLH